jgi:protein-S-isoprenylcysteine O-methyltransferase Ste14
MVFDSGTMIEVAWTVAILVWLAGSLTTKATVRRQSAGSRLLEIAPLLLGVVLVRTNRTLFRLLAVRFVPATADWQMIGAAVVVAGVAVAVWARFTLGKNWSATVTVKQEHELVRRGPYSVVRHPIYSGFLLAILGTAIYQGELKALLALVLASVTWKIKSLHEEAFMETEFGAQYTQYKREVKSLVPWIW